MNLLSEVLESLELCGLGNCRKLIVFDWFTLGKQTRSKLGVATQVFADRYQGYIRAVKREIDAANYPFENCAPLVMTSRQGFAFAVKTAMEEAVTSPYVMVVQHDYCFVRPVDVSAAVHVMQRHAAVKYVGFSSSTTMAYREQVQSIRGDREQVQKLEIQPVLGLGLPLLPLLFWYDKIHVAERAHYLSAVFGIDATGGDAAAAAGAATGAGLAAEDGSVCVVKRGEFIEDSFGQAQLADIKRHGLRAHAKYGTYLVDDGQGPMITHIDGKRYLTPTQRQERGFPAAGGRSHMKGR